MVESMYCINRLWLRNNTVNSNYLLVVSANANFIRNVSEQVTVMRDKNKHDL